MNPSDLTYTLTAEQDDTPIRGSFASGDDAADKELEDELLARLDQGDVWAWACVCVSVTHNGFKGVAYLGGCSYNNEAEFKADGYYRDMCKDAFADLRESMVYAVKRGELAAKTLKELDAAV